MKLVSLLPCLAVLMLSLSSCGQDQVEPLDLDLGYDYFPLEVGRSWTYEVDSLVFREQPGGIRIDSSRTLVREQVTDSLLDQAGQLVYRIERFERKNPAQPWQVRAVWTAARTQRQAIRTEDNLRFIKLVFPPKEGLEWDGNAFLPSGLRFLLGSREMEVFKGWNYRLSALDQPQTIGNLRFDSVLTVVQSDFKSIIELRSAVEQYARGVGLVYREWQLFDTQCRVCCQGNTGTGCQSLPWPQKAETGLWLRQRLIEYQ